LEDWRRQRKIESWLASTLENDPSGKPTRSHARMQRDKV